MTDFMSSFLQKLQNSWRRQHSLLCVGLDPNITKIPTKLRQDVDALFRFNREIIDATAHLVCAFKPQIAYYSAVAAENQLEKTIHYIQTHYPQIPVILDAKRGDIGATAAMYAKEAFERYQADAVTVNPYMGGETLEPFLQYREKGVIVLCRTSNAGSGEFQSLIADGRPLSHHVAMRAATQWNGHNNIALVVGATYPSEVGAIRRIVDEMPLLIPGIGTQGGNLKAILEQGLTKTGDGLVINVSRAIIHASDRADFAEKAAREASRLSKLINDYRSGSTTS